LTSPDLQGCFVETQRLQSQCHQDIGIPPVSVIGPGWTPRGGDRRQPAIRDLACGRRLAANDVGSILVGRDRARLLTMQTSRSSLLRRPAGEKLSVVMFAIWPPYASLIAGLDNAALSWSIKPAAIVRRAFLEVTVEDFDRLIDLNAASDFLRQARRASKMIQHGTNGFHCQHVFADRTRGIPPERLLPGQHTPSKALTKALPPWKRLLPLGIDGARQTFVRTSMTQGYFADPEFVAFVDLTHPSRSLRHS